MRTLLLKFAKIAGKIAVRLGSSKTLGLNPISVYMQKGRLPWSYGYSKYKDQFIREVFADDDLINRFKNALELPDNFGARLDERVVEYPWVLTRLRKGVGLIMDAGSTFNTPLIMDMPEIKNRKLIIYTFETDWITLRPNVSYMFGDLCSTFFKDGIFESIVCISTLEHIGMAQNIKEYSLSNPYPEAKKEIYRDAILEFRRLLEPGGQLLLTVPFGKYEDHGWFQQFNQDGIKDIIQTFGGSVRSETYYRYNENGWHIAMPDECAGAQYFNIHARKEFDPDYAAAARAVACLELET